MHGAAVKWFWLLILLTNLPDIFEAIFFLYYKSRIHWSILSGCSTFLTNLEFAFVERAGRHLQVRVAQVHKDDVTWLLLWRGQVLLVDTISQCRGCGIIQQSQTVQPSHLSCIKHSSTFCICEITRHLQKTKNETNHRWITSCLPIRQSGLSLFFFHAATSGFLHYCKCFKQSARHSGL